MAQQRFVSITLSTACGLCAIWISDAAAKDRLPNFIIVMADDCSAREFGCYGKGNATMERGPRVPMIVNCPTRVQPIGPSGALVSFVNIFATLVDLGGATMPDGYLLDGVSFGPILDGSKRHVRSWLFSYLADKRMLRDTRWLLDGNGTF